MKPLVRLCDFRPENSGNERQRSYFFPPWERVRRADARLSRFADRGV
jgi:hypothetical protein